MSLIYRFTLTAMFVGLTSSLLGADIYIKTKMTTPEFEAMGQIQKASEDIMEHWISDKRIASIMPSYRVIVDMEQKLFIRIDDKQRNYIRTTLPLDEEKLLPESMSGMMKTTSLEVKVKSTGQTRKIREWNCTGYEVSVGMGSMKMEQIIWATTEVPFDWKRFAEMQTDIIKLHGHVLSMFAARELSKIEGVHIETETIFSMMGTVFKTNAEVIEISEGKDAPTDIFSVPDGYSEINRLTLEQLQR